MDEALNAKTDVRALTRSSVAVAAPLGFAARVTPADLSGYWIEIFPLHDERTGVALGCCADAPTAERLGSAVRDELLDTADPVHSLDGLGGQPVSAICAVIGATSIGYSATGGVAAIAVPDDTPRILDERDGRLTVADLPPGTTVLLSSAPIDGADAALAGCAILHPDQVADQVVGRLIGSPGVAVLIYRHPPGPMTVTLPARPDSLAISRGRLREWLAAVGLDAETCADILLAAGEATANATEHAVVGVDHPVQLTISAALTGKQLRLNVSDNGRWKPVAMSPGHRGHGMHLINALVDSVELTTNSDGTTVAMLKELS